jgi:hypothetical protein
VTGFRGLFWFGYRQAEFSKEKSLPVASRVHWNDVLKLTTPHLTKGGSPEFDDLRLRTFGRS